MNLCVESVGDLRLRMVEQPCALSDIFAPNYYILVQHAGLPRVIGIKFAGQDRERALRSFERSRERAQAAFAAEWGASA